MIISGSPHKQPVLPQESQGLGLLRVLRAPEELSGGHVIEIDLSVGVPRRQHALVRGERQRTDLRILVKRLYIPHVQPMPVKVKRVHERFLRGSDVRPARVPPRQGIQGILQRPAVISVLHVDLRDVGKHLRFIALCLHKLVADPGISVQQKADKSRRNSRQNRKRRHHALRPVALLPAIERVIGTSDERRQKAQALRPEQPVPLLRGVGHNICRQRLHCVHKVPRLIADLSQLRRERLLRRPRHQARQNILSLVMLQKILDLPLHPNRTRGVRAADYDQILRIVQRDPDVLIQVVCDRQLLQIAEHQSELLLLLLFVLSQILRHFISLDPFVQLSGVLRVQRPVTIADKSFVPAPRSRRHSIIHFPSFESKGLSP